MSTRYPARFMPGGEFGYGTVIGGPLEGERHIRYTFGSIDGSNDALNLDPLKNQLKDPFAKRTHDARTV